jgi:hypothetical protein
VLVSNKQAALPLTFGKYKKIAVIGEDARAPSDPNKFGDHAGVDGTVIYISLPL